MVDKVQGFVGISELIFLGCASYFDLKNRAIPIFLLGVFGVLGIFYNVIWNYQKLEDLFLSVVIGCFFMCISWISKEAIGYGDSLSFIVLGLLEGGIGVLRIVFAAFLLSSLYCVWRLLKFKDKRCDTIPFLPFLFLATLGVRVL